jgi:photosystem II stability/assembly factor-like uncharacterized protein
MRILVLACALACAAPGLSSAAAWEPAGFGGAGNFLSVHFDANQPGVLYAASDIAGVLRSTDYGGTWELRSAGLGNVEVSSFAVDPFDPATLYAGIGAFGESNRAGIYVSHDSGLSWQHVPASYTNGITFRKYRTADAIAPDPSSQGVILSGSRENGIWRTADGGDSWTQVHAAPQTSAPLFNDGTIDDDPVGTVYPAPISTVAFDPVDPNVAYAGVDGFGVVRSDDGGTSGSWQAVNTGLPPQARVKSIAVGPGEVLYAAVGGSGVYRSTDGGSQWHAANGSLPPLGDDLDFVTSVAVHPATPTTAYLALATYDYANVWKTLDGGGTWVSQGNVAYDPAGNPTELWAGDPALTWHVALDPGDPQRLFQTGYWGIYRSSDAGEHWGSAIVGAQNTCVTDLAVDIDHPVGHSDVLYATHMDAGLLASTDRGMTWEMLVPREYDVTLAGHYWRVAITRVGDTKYYFATCDPWGWQYGRVLRSSDGVNWASVHDQPRPQGSASPLMAGSMLGLAADPTAPSTLYFTQDGGQVFKSTDTGSTWSHTPSQPPHDAFTYALTVDDGGQVFVGTHGGGLWRSEDGGASWDRVFAERDWIYHAVALSGAVYTTTGEDANLHRSTDGGDTWQQITDYALVDHGDGVGAHGMAVAVDPGNPQHILFTRMDTWHPADAGAGVAESTDGGLTWAEPNSGLRHHNVSALAFGSDGGVFLGTWGGGIWRSDEVGAVEGPGMTTATSDVLRMSPNPFGERAELRFDVGRSGPVTVSVHDLLGRKVMVLHDGYLPAGTHRVAWDGSGFPAGAYVTKLRVGTSVEAQRCVLSK